MAESLLLLFTRRPITGRVLALFGDAAIAPLRDDVVEIESDVDGLIRDMQASIREADAFLATLEKP